MPVTAAFVPATPAPKAPAPAAPVRFGLTEPGLDPVRVAAGRIDPVSGLREDALARGAFEALEAPALRVTLTRGDAAGGHRPVHPAGPAGRDRWAGAGRDPHRAGRHGRHQVRRRGDTGSHPRRPDTADLPGLRQPRDRLPAGRLALRSAGASPRGANPGLHGRCAEPRRPGGSRRDRGLHGPPDGSGMSSNDGRGCLRTDRIDRSSAIAHEKMRPEYGKSPKLGHFRGTTAPLKRRSIKGGELLSFGRHTDGTHRQGWPCARLRSLFSASSPPRLRRPGVCARPGPGGFRPGSRLQRQPSAPDPRPSAQLARCRQRALTSNVPGAGGSGNPALNPYLIAASNQLNPAFGPNDRFGRGILPTRSPTARSSARAPRPSATSTCRSSTGWTRPRRCTAARTKPSPIPDGEKRGPSGPRFSRFWGSVTHRCILRCERRRSPPAAQVIPGALLRGAQTRAPQDAAGGSGDRRLEPFVGSIRVAGDRGLGTASLI